jgi:hypothetical protein
MILRTEADRRELIARILKINIEKQPWEITANKWKPASELNDMKAVANIWYSEIGRQAGMTPLEVANYCKWTYGCPLLASVDQKFSDIYEGMMDRYEYEECVAMMEFVGVTSNKKMNRDLMHEYLQHIELYAVEGGYNITKRARKVDIETGEELKERGLM